LKGLLGNVPGTAFGTIMRVIPVPVIPMFIMFIMPGRCIGRGIMGVAAMRTRIGGAASAGADAIRLACQAPTNIDHASTRVRTEPKGKAVMDLSFSH
jgi:hypothetical protein